MKRAESLLEETFTPSSVTRRFLISHQLWNQAVEWSTTIFLTLPPCSINPERRGKDCDGFTTMANCFAKNPVAALWTFELGPVIHSARRQRLLYR
jgi:hypothetical protein